MLYYCFPNRGLMLNDYFFAFVFVFVFVFVLLLFLSFKLLSSAPAGPDLIGRSAGVASRVGEASFSAGFFETRFFPGILEICTKLCLIEIGKKNKNFYKVTTLC